MKRLQVLVLLPFLTFTLLAVSGGARPLHLVKSDVGNSLVLYHEEGELDFGLLVEIQGSLNFSVSGKFKKAEIVKASTVAPDGKRYALEALGEQPQLPQGSYMRFLSIKFGNTYSRFSIGKWEIEIVFKIDGEEYTHRSNHLVTWRKPGGMWEDQEWVNERADTEKLKE